ncbi:LysM peptidoglycan-binding domain-containing protein [bacterium]|nr:LysM peptidoglycan-binding domain-containing protein [bacterium]
MKKIAIIFLMLLFVTSSFAHKGNIPHYVKMENPAGLVNPDGFFEYMIVKGDCLWFIADQFYNDPFRWTKIHKANPYIIDPDWIYPNNWLVIPNVFADASGKPLYSETGVKPIISKDELAEETVKIDAQEANATVTVTTVPESLKDKDMDGKTKIDDKTKATKDKTSKKGLLKDKNADMYKPCIESYCGKPGWKLGLHAGYPLGSAPEDETLNVGLLLGTPLGVKTGPLSVGLGAGAFTYDFDKFYFGGGLLASLCINDLLNMDMPLVLQLHGVGFYIFGEDQGLGFGGIGSASVPFGKSPVSLGLYGGLGKYYPNDNEYNWGNVGAVLFYKL